jgi:hypothetical protein
MGRGQYPVRTTAARPKGLQIEQRHHTYKQYATFRCERRIAMNRLHPLAFGVALGLLWAVSLTVLAIIAMLGWGEAMVDGLGSFYFGYEPTASGLAAGAAWGIADGFIGGFAVAWIYNAVAKSMGAFEEVSIPDRADPRELASHR